MTHLNCLLVAAVLLLAPLTGLASSGAGPHKVYVKDNK